MNMKHGIFAALVLFVGTAVMAQEPDKKQEPKKKEVKKNFGKKIEPKKTAPVKTN